MQTSKHHKCVTSSDTGLRNANINTIYQITIVSHQDRKRVLVGAVGWGELFWKEIKRAEPISRSQVVKLKLCDPVISQVGCQTAGCCVSWQRKWGPSAEVGVSMRQCVDVTSRLGTTGFC